MKNAPAKKSPGPRLRPSGFPMKRGERKAFLASVRQLDEQCDSLGVLDPAEIEPAVLYHALEEER